MSSPIHTLIYAPRRAREQAQQLPTLPAAPQIELPDRGLSGDFGMLERQLALNPDALPEPPRLRGGEDCITRMRHCRRCSGPRVGHGTLHEHA